jgi:hypothetical protein
VKNALVWVKPAVTTGLVTTHTDAQGRYLVKNLPELPYKVFAWAQPEFAGKHHCLRLGHDALGDYEPIYPNAVRNFRWQLEGKIQDRGDQTFFGGELRLMPVYRQPGDFDIHANLQIEVRFVANGTLVDGSPGKTITRKLNWNDTDFARDIPVGSYTVNATLITPDSSRSALEVGANESSLAAQSALEFVPSSSSCGGNFGNGTARAFLSIARP